MRCVSYAVLLALLAVTMPARAADPACRADADCPEGNTCSDGVCEAPRRESRARRFIAPHERPHTAQTFPGIWISGLVVFGGSWIATIVLAGVVVDKPDKNQAIGHAFVPAAGPVIMGGADYDLKRAEGALPALCAAQTAGLVFTFLGLTTFRVEPVEGDAETTSIAPAVWPGGAGVTGRF